MVERIKELLNCSKTKDIVYIFIIKIFHLILKEDTILWGYSVRLRVEECSKKLRRLSNMTGEYFANTQDSYLENLDFLYIYKNDSYNNNTFNNIIRLFASDTKKNSNIIKYIGSEYCSDIFYFLGFCGTEKKDCFKMNCLMVHFALKIIESIHNKHTNNDSVETNNILSAIERILSKCHRDKVEKMIELYNGI